MVSKEILQKHPRKQSRKVTKKDLKRVRKDAEVLYHLCFQPLGKYPNALALAHVQIEAEDPLRFFVRPTGEVVINPKIVEATESYTNKEGCFSFAYRSVKKVKRFKKIKVEYYAGHLQDRKLKLDETITMEYEGLEAAVFQHEIGHFNLDLVYP